METVTKVAPEWAPVPPKVGHQGGFDSVYPDKAGSMLAIHTRKTADGSWKGIMSYDDTAKGAHYFTKKFDGHNDAAKAITNWLDNH